MPTGLTKSYIDTLASRGAPFSLGGTVVVSCVHGSQKRANVDRFECDLVKDGHPHLCPCCESFYAKHSDEPGPCHTCTPQRSTR